MNRLADAGWVGCEADPADGRAQQVGLTDVGRERLHRHRADRSHRIAGRLALPSEADRAVLDAALRHLVAPRPGHDKDS